MARILFLPAEFHGQRSLASYSPWDCKESDRTKPASTYLSVHPNILTYIFKCTYFQMYIICIQKKGQTLVLIYIFSKESVMNSSENKYPYANMHA